MKKIFFFLVIALFFASAVRDVSAAQRGRAGAQRGEKPKVILNVDMGDIRYFYKKKREIDCKTPNAAGCTHIEMYGNFAVLSGSKGIVGLVVNIGFKDFIVDVASEYPKGSCEFDLILKHELTHVAFARAVVERYSAELGAALLAEADKMRPPVSRRDIRRLSDIANEYLSEMNRIQQEQHDLMDSKGNNSYQWEQCRGK